MIYRILIVEDHEVNRTLISCMLKNFNLLHDLAENGQVALEMIQCVQYDLVLMDIFMPVMNGFEALDKIKKHNNLRVSKIPIIAVTAKPELEGIDKFDAVIPKPLNINKFNEVLSLFINL